MLEASGVLKLQDHISFHSTPRGGRTLSEAPHLAQIHCAVVPLADTQARARNPSLPTKPQGLPNVHRHSNDRVKPRQELALFPAPDAQRGASEGAHVTAARERADGDGV